jgi:hypothetical protein
MKVVAVLVLLIALVMPQPVFAGSGEDSWDSLAQLAFGQKIEVTEMSLKSVKGSFMGYTSEEIVIRENNRDMTIPRSRVYRVKNLQKFHRVRSAVVGSLLGGLAGIATGALVTEGIADKSEIPYGAWIGFLIGAPSGAALGAVGVPSAVTIYKAKVTSDQLRQE